MSPPDARRGPATGPRSDQTAAKRIDQTEDTEGTETHPRWATPTDAAVEIVDTYGIPFARELAAAIRTLPGVRW